MQSVPEGPMVTCPYDSTLGVGLRQEGGLPDKPQLTFYGKGALRTFDGADCTYDATAPHTQGDCQDHYLCGDCSVEITHFGQDRYVRAECGTDLGFYGLCTPAPCGSKQCGNDGCGTICGTCGDPNEDCVDGVCQCPSGCQQGLVCCGGSLCADDCVGTPCC